MGQLAINPNTVLKAYRELDLMGLTEGRRGQGTFLSADVASSTPSTHVDLQAALLHWVAAARAAGFDADGISALVAQALHDTSTKGVA